MLPNNLQVGVLQMVVSTMIPTSLLCQWIGPTNHENNQYRSKNRIHYQHFAGDQIQLSTVETITSVVEILSSQLKPLKPPRSLALPLHHLGAGPSFGSWRLLFQVKDAAVIVLDEVYLRAAKATSSMVIHMVISAEKGHCWCTVMGFLMFIYGYMIVNQHYEQW